MALLAALLMPFGLETLPLMLMQQGLRLVMVISDWVAGWPKAGVTLPLLSQHAAAGLSFAAAFVAMPRSALRWLALPVAAVRLRCSGRRHHRMCWWRNGQGPWPLLMAATCWCRWP
jgi:hypothetical protein